MKITYSIPKSFSTVQWVNIRFDKTLEYNYTPDMTELMKDSSVTVPDKDFLTKYDSCAHHYNRKSPEGCKKRSKASQRAILVYLKSRPEDVEIY